MIGFHGGNSVLVLDVFGSTAGSGVMVLNEDLIDLIYSKWQRREVDLDVADKTSHNATIVARAKAILLVE